MEQQIKELIEKYRSMVIAQSQSRKEWASHYYELVQEVLNDPEAQSYKDYLSRMKERLRLDKIRVRIAQELGRDGLKYHRERSDWVKRFHQAGKDLSQLTRDRVNDYETLYNNVKTEWRDGLIGFQVATIRSSSRDGNQRAIIMSVRYDFLCCNDKTLDCEMEIRLPKNLKKK